MKLFDTVVIGCDNSPDMIKDARAIRAALEVFGLRVYLYDLTRRRETLQFLAGEIPSCEYVVLCCHGSSDRDGSPQIGLQVVDQRDGDYDKGDGWEQVEFGLTPANIPAIVGGNGRTLICYACGAGGEAFAQAFLNAGCRAYIAAGGRGAYANAAVLFVIGFFYHLVTATRIDDEPTSHTDAEAVLLASAMDADYPRGTRAFHYFSSPQT